MKTTFRTLALIVALVVIAVWLATGSNRGWSKTSREIKTLDDITGIEGITHEKAFLPGVDFLGAGLAGAAVLAGASFFVRSKSH